MKKLLVIALTLALGSNAWGMKRKLEEPSTPTTAQAEAQAILEQAKKAYFANNLDDALHILEGAEFEEELGLEADVETLSNSIRLRRNTSQLGTVGQPVDLRDSTVASLEANVVEARDPIIRRIGLATLAAYYQQRLTQIAALQGAETSAKKPRKQ